MAVQSYLNQFASCLLKSKLPRQALTQPSPKGRGLDCPSQNGTPLPARSPRVFEFAFQSAAFTVDNVSNSPAGLTFNDNVSDRFLLAQILIGGVHHSAVFFVPGL